MTPQQVPQLLPAPGRMAVDFEERVNFDRLREYRLSRARAALEASELGALLCFDVNNVRYLTSTQIGEWVRDKVCRYALLARGSEPVLWDFGSAAAHHRLHAPWLRPENSRAGMLGLRGAVAPGAGLMDAAATEIKALLDDAGVGGAPVGVDIAETPMLFALQRAGIDVHDGQQVMLDARQNKSFDEIALLTMSAAMVDGAYQLISEILKPGIRENEIVGAVNEFLYKAGSDDVEAINAVSGERCSPHPHNFSDRMIRPGDQAFFDIIQAYNGYRTCYYRTFGVGRATASQRDAYKQARVDRPGDRPREAGRRHRRDRPLLATGHRLRLLGRDGSLRAAVRPWARARPAREADHKPAQFPRAPRRDRGGNGVRTRDLLPGVGRSLGRTYRGGDRGDR